MSYVLFVPLDVENLSDEAIGAYLLKMGEEFPDSGGNYAAAVCEEALKRYRKLDEGIMSDKKCAVCGTGDGDCFHTNMDSPGSPPAPGLLCKGNNAASSCADENVRRLVEAAEYIYGCRNLAPFAPVKEDAARELEAALAPWRKP